MAHKKGLGSTRNGRDSHAQRLGVKKFGGERIKTGQIIGQRGDLTAFSDAGSVAVWARDAVSWAVGVGILNGSGGKLFPEDGAQRAQVAAMLHRFQDWMDAQ